MMKSMFLIAALCLAISTSARANDDCTDDCFLGAGTCASDVIYGSGVCQASAWAAYGEDLFWCSNLGGWAYDACLSAAEAGYDSNVQHCNDDMWTGFASCSAAYDACMAPCD